jgi:ribosomal protein S9
LAGIGVGVAGPRIAQAFGDEGAFHARIIDGANGKYEDELSAARRWAFELTHRTSAPGRLSAELVDPASSTLLKEPFAIWAGKDDPGALSPRAVKRLREYLKLGGTLVIDDRASRAEDGKFGPGARREMQRILPEASFLRLPADHVLYKSYYILEEPLGRRPGPPFVEAIVQGKTAQVLLLNHDLLGALAHKNETWTHPMEGGGSEARERAVRFAVNIAMYVLCSDYKDDQVHAPFLMRRRHKKR